MDIGVAGGERPVAGSVDIRLLGPVEVLLDGARVACRPAERELLALLALDAGSVVSVDQLIDALWGEELAADPHNALEVRVARLRRALVAAGDNADVVVTRHPGYLLGVAREVVDVHRFAALVADARSVSADDPVAAERLYAGALGQWRGDAFGEFGDRAWVRPERARLEELRIAAQEERIDAMLASGRHAAALAELEALVASYPLRERFRGQQMIALYRAGRQAEALAVYADARSVLLDEFGLDPSPELQRVEALVLRQDESLAPPRGQISQSRMLPVRLSSFIDREAELVELVTLLHDHRLVTVSGAGGVGKSTLAIEAARGEARSYRDGVVLVRLADVDQAERLQAAVADAVSLTPADPATSVTAGRRLVDALAPREVLLLLDNCEHLIDACALLIENVLGSCPNVHVLATSREPLAIPGEAQLRLQPFDLPAGDRNLDVNSAAALFVARARDVNPHFEVNEASASLIARICRQLDGIPLAIELAAAHAATVPLSVIAAGVSDPLGYLTSGRRLRERRHRSLREAIDWSYMQLDSESRVLFRRLAVFRGGWTADAAEVVCGDESLPSDIVTAQIDCLVTRSLIEADPERGRFRLLAPLRQYAGEQLSEMERAVLERRHAEQYLAFAERAQRALRGREQHAWMHRLVDERDNLDAALAWAVEHARTDPDVGLRLVGALAWWWYFGRHDEGRHWVDAMLGAATVASDEARAAAHLAAALVWRPGACVVHPSPQCAHHAAECLRVAEAAGDIELAAYARVLLAVEGVANDERTEALAMLDEADAAFKTSGDAWGSALAAFVRSEVDFYAPSRFAQADREASRAALGFRTAGDGWGESAVLAHHGLALRRMARISDAIAVYERAAAISDELELSQTMQWAHAELAYCAFVLGNEERALRHSAIADAVADRFGAGVGAAFAGHVRGMIAQRRGQTEAAVDLLEQAADSLADAGVAWGAAETLAALARVNHSMGDGSAARLAADAALQHAMWAPISLPVVLEAIATVVGADDPEGAALLLGAAAKGRADMNRPLNAFEAMTDAPCVALVRKRLGKVRFNTKMLEGREVDPVAAAATILASV